PTTPSSSAALVLGCGAKPYGRHSKVRREGAPNSSRGGCAPLRSLCLLPVPMDWGARPPPGAADDALVVGMPVRGCRSKQYARHTEVRREGAPNSSRGGCEAGQAPLRLGTLLTWENSPALAAAVKSINCFLSEILPSGDVDGFEPTLLPPTPGGALRHPQLLQPSGKAVDRRAVRIPLAVRFNFHKFGILPPAL